VGAVGTMLTPAMGIPTGFVGWVNSVEGARHTRKGRYTPPVFTGRVHGSMDTRP